VTRPDISTQVRFRKEQEMLRARRAARHLVWRGQDWRVVRVDDADFPGFYRVICNRHVSEFSDLPGPQREQGMTLVALVEQALRTNLVPVKVNLASLGNQVPHLHWHVVARFADDSRYPDPIWAPARRATPVAAIRSLQLRLPALDAALASSLAAWAGGAVAGHPPAD
jgi:diadenosine tetraphosphate (Ap4A) HIT family hydrolase